MRDKQPFVSGGSLIYCDLLWKICRIRPRRPNTELQYVTQWYPIALQPMSTRLWMLLDTWTPMLGPPYTRQYSAWIPWAVWVSSTGFRISIISTWNCTRPRESSYTVVGLRRSPIRWYIDGLVQERRNSIVNALELRLSILHEILR